MTPDVPFVVHEADMSRMERTIKRLWILCIVLIALLMATNAGWIYYESQFEYFQTEIEAEQDGDVNIVGGGDVTYGTESDSQN